MRLKLFLTATILTSLFFILAAAPALAGSKIVSVTVDNPDEALEDAVLVFFIPYNLVPVNVADNMIWDEDNRQLEVDMNGFVGGESKVVNFTLQGPEGTYLVTGRLAGHWQSDGDAFEGVIEPFTVVMEPEIISPIAKSAMDLSNAIKDIVVPISIALGALGVGSVAASIFSASSLLASEVVRILSYLGLGLFFAKKRKPWGKVYNQLTNKPIHGAIVRLVDAEFKKTKETQMTDKDGRFGFLAETGNYYIKVSYRGFEEKQAEKMNRDIPLTPLISNLPPKKMRLAGWITTIKNVLDAINIYVLIVGTLLSLAAAIVVPVVLNYIVLGVYVVLWAVKILMKRWLTRSFGRAMDRTSGIALPLTVVRLFSADNSWLLGTRVTDALGRFNFLIGQGSYYITAVQEGFRPFQSLPVEFTKANVLAMDVRLDKLP